MKIFVIGGSGLVGGNCLKHFKEQGAEVIASHRSFETPDTVYFNSEDMADPANFDVKTFAPEVIVHTGALTHVDYCEQHPDESYARTVQSAKHIIGLCQEIGARLVYTSTDYVFDGLDGPYTEDAPVRPLGVYARHKLEVEEMIAKELPTSIVLRITNVYGDEIRGKNFIARIVNDVKNGREWTMKLPYDQYATPANAYDIARVTWHLLQDGKQGIYHVASTDFINRVQLAKRVLSYLPDHKCTIIPTATSDLGQASARPLTGGLLSTKFLSEYPDFEFSNVDDYLRKVTA